MASRKKSTEEKDAVEELSVSEETPETPKKRASTKKKAPAVQVMPVRKPKPVSFDLWAKRRGVKEHHKGGLRAYVSNPSHPRSMDAWDAAFADY